MNKTYRQPRIPKINLQIAAGIVAICVLFAYWFLFFDNNSELEDSTITKIAAVIYPVALLIIGLLLKTFKNKSFAIFAIVAVYMVVNYIIFKKGIKNDFITLFVVMAFVIARDIRYDSNCIKTIFIFELIMFAIIVVCGYYYGDNYISSLFPSMRINANTMSQLILVNMFIGIVLTNKRKYAIVRLLIYTLGIVLLYFSASRTAMLCGILLCVGHLISYKIKTATLYKIFVISLILSIMFVFVYAYVLPSIVPDDYFFFGKKLFTGRHKIYVAVLDNIFSSPTTMLFGYGFVSFGMKNGAYLNTHNLWLQLWLQYGVFIMIIVLFLFIKTVRSYLSQKTQMSNIYIVYCICLVILCMLESPLTGRTMSVLLLLPLIVGRLNLACRYAKETCVSKSYSKRHQIKGVTLRGGCI